MGQENIKCCCKSKEIDELNIGTIKKEIIENEEELFHPKIKEDINLKDLKTYIHSKNISITKDDVSINNISDIKDDNLKRPSILLHSKKYNIQKEISGESYNNQKRKSKKNLSKRVSFGVNSSRNLVSLKNKSDDKNHLLYYNKIQSVYRGYIYRKKIFPKLKIELNNHLMKLLKELYEKYLTNKLKSQEENLGIRHDKNTYKTLLNLELEKKSNRKMIILFTKLYILKYNNKNAFYIGQITIKNILSGNGILTLENGEKYSGIFENNKLKSGKFIDEDGIYYEGNFNLTNKLEGNGKKITLNNESIYIGNFNNGLKEGNGSEETNKIIYEGHFKTDKKNGFGKLYYKEINEHYEGQFSNDNITGIGKYFWSNGEIYEGTLVNGKMNGKGIYTWPDGGRYEGNYINNIKEGNGIFIWANGKIFEGPFKNGKPNGEGILINGEKKFKVKFVNGILNKHVKEYKGIDGRYSNDEQSVSASFISKFNNEKILFDKDMVSRKKNKGRNKKDLLTNLKENINYSFGKNIVLDNSNNINNSNNNFSKSNNNNSYNDNDKEYVKTTVKRKKKKIFTEKDLINLNN